MTGSARQASESNLHLVSWNLHGVPGASRSQERFAAAAKEILRRRPDVALLQEVWRQGQVDQLAEVLGPAGYAQAPLPQGGLFGRTGGLLAWVHEASGWELTEPGFHEFENEAPDWKLWEGDGFGDKGVQHFVVRRDTVAVRLLNTHLQAAYEPGRYVQIRARQLREVHALAQRLWDRHGKHALPIILAGDLNTTPDETAFAELPGWEDLTREERRRCACGTTVGSESPEWLDYAQALLPPDWSVAAKVELIRSVARDDPFSDHQGLDVSLAFRQEDRRRESASRFFPVPAHGEAASVAAGMLSAAAAVNLLRAGDRRAFLRNGALLALSLAFGGAPASADRKANSDTLPS